MTRRCSTSTAPRWTPSSASAAAQAERRHRWPARLPPSGCCIASWPRRACDATTRPPTSRASACRPASLIHCPRTRSSRCWQRRQSTSRSALRDRALLEFLYATGARISEACGLSLGDFDHEEQLVRLFGKGSKERIVPYGRHAAAALAEWLGPSGRPHMQPQRWARRGDAEAVFLNLRGARLSRQAAWAMVKKYGDRIGLGHQAVAARAAAFVCDPSARSRGRSSNRPGAARARVDLDDAGVHEGQPGAALRRLPIGASASARSMNRSPRRPSRAAVRHVAVAA